MKLTKYSLIPVIILSFFAFSSAAFAQKTIEYRLLEPVPFVSTQQGQSDCKTEDGAPCATANSYIPGLVKLIIAVAGALAVVKIIFGGIQYMSTDAFQGKNDARKTIQNAIWGLILTMSAWLILYTLNPNLVNFDFSIEGQAIGEDFSSITSISSTTPGSVARGPSYGKTWGDDAGDRADIEKIGETTDKSVCTTAGQKNCTPTKIAKISFNHPNCKTIGELNCTSVSGLSSSVLSGLSNLRKGCECTFTITGGTEYWNHGTKNTELYLNTRTQHRPGGNALDLRKSVTKLDNFIISKTRVSGSGCSTLGPAYGYNGMTFVDEGNHWHACF